MAETDKLSPNRFRLSLARMLFFALFAALLFSAGLFVPILGFWCLLMSPLPLALLGMREGLRWQTTGMRRGNGGEVVRGFEAGLPGGTEVRPTGGATEPSGVLAAVSCRNGGEEDA